MRLVGKLDHILSRKKNVDYSCACLNLYTTNGHNRDKCFRFHKIKDIDN